MYSLDNAMDLDELDIWMDRTEEALGCASSFGLRTQDRWFFAGAYSGVDHFHQDMTQEPVIESSEEQEPDLEL